MSIAPCDRCNGAGELVFDPCPECHGRGILESDRSVSVEIPPGVSDGTRLRLTGQGEAGIRGTAQGDLYVEIHVRPDPRFERDGIDLHHLFEVGLAQAALGFDGSVPLLDGGESGITIPSGTQPGAVFRIVGQGIPRLGRRGRGDLLVHVNLAVPTSLGPDEEDLLRSYAEVTGEKVTKARRRRKAR